jgi:hypothetical protein
LSVLDRRIELLTHKVDALERMRTCVREGRLQELVELVCAEAEMDRESAALDQRIDQMRADHAALRGLDPQTLTLGQLAREVEGPAGLALSDRRERLVLLVEKVRAEAETTARLVQFAMEFNSELIGDLTGEAGDGTTYGADGAMGRTGATATFERTV